MGQRPAVSRPSVAPLSGSSSPPSRDRHAEDREDRVVEPVAVPARPPASGEPSAKPSADDQGVPHAAAQRGEQDELAQRHAVGARPERRPGCVPPAPPGRSAPPTGRAARTSGRPSPGRSRSTSGMWSSQRFSRSSPSAGAEPVEHQRAEQRTGRGGEHDQHDAEPALGRRGSRPSPARPRSGIGGTMLSSATSRATPSAPIESMTLATQPVSPVNWFGSTFWASGHGVPSGRCRGSGRSYPAPPPAHLPVAGAPDSARPAARAGRRGFGAGEAIGEVTEAWVTGGTRRRSSTASTSTRSRTPTATGSATSAG